MNPLVAFLIVSAPPSRTLAGVEVASACPRWNVVAVDANGTAYETEIRSRHGVTVYCWGGFVLTVEQGIEDGRQARNALSARWGKPASEPLVDEYTWADARTVARLEYTAEPRLSVSDAGLLREWSLTKKRALYAALWE